jgi:saccharopepsin
LSLIVAASLLGAADARVHKLKINKVPLSEQFHAASFNTQLRNLNYKYSGFDVPIQPGHAHDSPLSGEGLGHIVPISNYANAQCTLK